MIPSLVIVSISSAELPAAEAGACNEQYFLVDDFLFHGVCFFDNAKLPSRKADP